MQDQPAIAAILSAKETIKTWKWRIVKAGHNGITFAELLGIAPSVLSEYMSGKKSPSLERYDHIEGKLKELGV
jgi:transcriptional regulator with XRE-family HTH domain